MWKVQRARRRRRLVIAGFITLGILAAVAIGLTVRSGDGESIAPFTLVEQAYANVPSSGRTLGDPNAPVTVIEYGDYQCPGCGYFAREVERQLVDVSASPLPVAQRVDHRSKMVIWLLGPRKTAGPNSSLNLRQRSRKPIAMPLRALR